MKKLITILTCITFFSCSKDANTPANQIVQQSATGSIQYKINDTPVVMNNVDLLSGQYVIFAKQLKGTVLTETRYILNAQKGANNIFLFALITDSLHEINYHYDSSVIAGSENIASFLTTYNAQESGLFFNGDYLDINISSYKNSRISGTFTAKLTPFSNITVPGTTGQHGSTIITDGKINNVQVIY